MEREDFLVVKDRQSAGDALSPNNLCWEVKAKVIHALSSPLSFFQEVTVVGKESVNTTRSV